MLAAALAQIRLHKERSIMNDTLKMFLIALITAVIVQLILGPEIMKMRGMVPAQPQPQQQVPVTAPVGTVAPTPAVAPTQVQPPSTEAPKPTIAPNYLTLPVNKARELAHSQGIVVIEDGQKPVEGTPAGQIVEQVPAAGSPMPNAEIRVIVAAAADSKKVPTVVGKQVEEAKKALEGAGFTVETVDKESPKTKGTVLSQKPKGGDKAGLDKPIVLEVASLPMVEVPKITGRYLSRAKSSLKGVGLSVGNIRRVEHEEHGENFVLRQDPEAGSKVAFGAEINLTVVAPN